MLLTTLVMYVYVSKPPHPFPLSLEVVVLLPGAFLIPLLAHLLVS